MSSAAAASRLGRSRYAVARAVADGRLPGYGIVGEQRTRWYAYEDALGAPPTTASVSEERDHYRARAATYEAVIARLLAANEWRREADTARERSLGLLADAVRAAVVADELRARAEQEQEDALRQVVWPSLVPET